MAPRAKLQLSALLATVILAIAPAAGAQTPVPPGNSAVNQYTETFPSGHGEVHTGSRHGKRTPEQVLGKGNAARLAQQGATGEKVAALVAATAPESTHRGRPATVAPGGGAGSPSGSSGLGQVVGHATGASSDGGLGLLLQLALFAGALWAALFALRRRRTTP